MQNPNVNQNSTNNEPAWYLLAEYSLSNFTEDKGFGDELTVEGLFQATQDLGIPVELLNIIESTLTEFSRKAMARLNQGKLESPIIIRLFSQKKKIEEVDSARTASNINKGPAQIIRQYGTKMSGGWGYFLIERGGAFPPSPSGSTCNLVDLYLYKEGK